MKIRLELISHEREHIATEEYVCTTGMIVLELQGGPNGNKTIRWVLDEQAEKNGSLARSETIPWKKL